MFHEANVVAAVHPHHQRSDPTKDDTPRLLSQYQIPSVVDYLVSQETPYQRVAVQFPDSLLPDSVSVLQLLEERLRQHPQYSNCLDRLERRLNGGGAEEGSSKDKEAGGVPLTSAAALKAASTTKLDNPNKPSTREIRFYVLADNTFGSCCPDEITAAHYQTEVILHYGPACYSRNTRLPVLYVHPDFHFSQLSVEGGDRYREQCYGKLLALLIQRVITVAEAKLSLFRQIHGEEEMTPRYRLVVLASHSTYSVLEAARNSLEADASHPVGKDTIHWCAIDQQTSPEGLQEKEKEEKPKEMEELPPPSADWSVSGIHLPRLSPTDKQTVYLYFALLPSAVERLLLANLNGIIEYNHFHYGEAQQELLEHLLDTTPVEETNVNLTELMAVDEHFGTEGEEKKECSAAVKLTASSEWSSSSLTSEDDHSIGEWVRALEANGSLALYHRLLAEAQLMYTKRSRQREYNLEQIRDSSSIGILLATLSTRYYYETATQLFQLCRLYKKRSYFIYIGHLNEYKIANFVDAVDVFTVISCPFSEECNYSDKKKYHYAKPLVSPMEVILALTTEGDEELIPASEEGEREGSPYGRPCVYLNSLADLQHELQRAIRRRKTELTSTAKEEATSTGAPSGALVQVAGDGTLTTLYQSVVQDSLARFHERGYTGLDPMVGKTPVQKQVESGLHGIAKGYTVSKEGEEGGATKKI